MKRQEVTASYLPILQSYGLERIPLERLSLLRYHRGEYVYRSGSEMKYLTLVVRGRAKVCQTSENGKGLLLAFYSGTGLLGDIELMLNRSVAISDVQAISDFTAIGVPFSLANELLQNHTFILRLARNLALHVEHNTQNTIATVLNPLEARLCSYIATMAENGFFREKLTVLAELLGTSYRHLLRTLDALCKKEVLLKEPDRYSVADAAALKRLGGDMYRF